MSKKYFLFLVAGLLAVGFLGISPAAAQLGAAQANLGNALHGTGLAPSLDTTIGLVIKGLLSLVGTIFLLLTIYAGILWMTAQGNEDSVTKAKAIIQAAIIGLIITMAAYAITAFVTSKLSGAGGSGGNNSGVTPTGSCNGSCESGTCASGETEDGTGSQYCSSVVTGAICCVSSGTGL